MTTDQTDDRNPDGSPSWVPFGPEADQRRAEGDEYVRNLRAGSEHGGYPPLPPPTHREAYTDARTGQPYSGWTPAAPPPKRSWFARHKILTGLGAVVALVTIVGVASAGGGGNVAVDPAASASAPAMPSLSAEQEAANRAASNAPPAPRAPTATAKPATAKPAPKPAPPPDLTVSQENAVGAARDYLAMSGFSRTGLIEQLKFEGYSSADAAFAVDYLHPNWNEQARRVAQSYLDTQNFSRSGLIAQLRFEGFTRAQATYAADKVGL